MNDYTMVPLRAISEMFGATVNWDGGTSTVTIDYTKKNVEEGLAKKFETYEKVLNQKYDAYKNYADDTGNIVRAEIQLEDGGNIELDFIRILHRKRLQILLNLQMKIFMTGLCSTEL